MRQRAARKSMESQPDDQGSESWVSVFGSWVKLGSAAVYCGERPRARGRWRGPAPNPEAALGELHLEQFRVICFI